MDGAGRSSLWTGQSGRVGSCYVQEAFAVEIAADVLAESVVLYDGGIRCNLVAGFSIIQIIE